jgi:acetolactate synthase-1/2/3 large subunit
MAYEKTPRTPESNAEATPAASPKQHSGKLPAPSVPPKRATKRTMKAAETIMEVLTREGTEHFFGHPGGATLPMYDALYHFPNIRHYLVRHEQIGVHAASGFARATGKPGVCTGTSGPGATNLITGLTDAMLDSTPIVTLTGQVVTTWIGKDGFQEADITGMTIPATKHNWLVHNENEVASTVYEAFKLAMHGRQGPVLVDVPRDVFQRPVEFDAGDLVAKHSYRAPSKPSPHALEAAAEAIVRAERPIIYVGGGAISSNCSAELLAFCEKLGAPVATTLMGKGAFPETHELSVGMLGMHGTATANYTMHDSDLIVALGARFDDRVTLKLETFAPKAKVVHVEIDPAEVNKNRVANYPLHGDLRVVLQELTPLVARKLQHRTADHLVAWWRQVSDWRTKHPLVYHQGANVILPQFAIDTLYKLTREQQPIVTTDVGQHQMWTAQFFKFDKPRKFITSGGLGTMGYGMPAAMGAQVGCPETLTLCISGDGSFMQCVQTLMTASENKIPIKVFVMNNHHLGMVRQWQELFYEERYKSVHMPNQNIAKIAEAFGCVGLEARNPDEMERVFKQALAVSDKPVVVDVHCDREENCYPMWPSGTGIEGMIIDDPRYAEQRAAKQGAQQ